MPYGLDSMSRWTKRATAPAMDVMNRFYTPTFEGAYKEAQGMDQLPGMRSAEDTARENMMGNWNRVGMAGSGAAFGQDLASSRAFGQDRFAAGLQGRVQKFNALSSLAGKSLSGGMQGLQARNQVQSLLAAERERQRRIDEKNRQQRQAATGQMVGDIVGTAVDFGTAFAAGGATAPMAFSNAMSRFGGGGGGQHSSVNTPDSGYYDENGKYIPNSMNWGPEG